jgi:hypothetical protein
MCLNSLLWIRIWNLYDPGSRMENFESRIRDKSPRSATLRRMCLLYFHSAPSLTALTFIVRLLLMCLFYSAHSENTSATHYSFRIFSLGRLFSFHAFSNTYFQSVPYPPVLFFNSVHSPTALIVII